MRYCFSLRSAPSRGIVSSIINGSSCAHSGCMLGITPSAAKRSEVGVVDQLRVRDHRPPVARPVGGDDMLDRVQRLASGRIADRVDVDLKPEFVDGACRVGKVAPTPACRGCAASRNRAPAVLRSRSR